jgi:phosphopantothenoylcysteine decarboxylase/phosphopantothenate--cysteine ligase
MAVVLLFYTHMLKGKKILLGITASIAAYKAILLVRLLVKAGAEVKIVMTPSAKDFVSPLTLSTLSKNAVLYNVADEDTWANHVMLGRWADIMLVAPCSCNTLAKMAKGICDNLLQAVYLSATCPVVISPAMDEDMWHHPATKKNIETVIGYGNKVIPAEHGELASGLIGEGRMPEPDTIITYLEQEFFRSDELKGKKAIVTAGPTYEAIDPVRFVGNHSSGKMGIALAEELYLRGADVELIIGPTHLKTQFKGIATVKVHSADEMYKAAVKAFVSADIAVMSAAVADYKPSTIAKEKIKKKDDTLTLDLVKTKDILQSLGKEKKSSQLVVGFALETNNEKEHAINKLKTKNADLIVLNSLQDSQAGFGLDTNKITIFDNEGNEFNYPVKSKKELATDIVDLIIKKISK